MDSEIKSIPSSEELLVPTIEALKRLGGSGNIDEITEKLVQLGKYSEDIQSRLHDDGPESELEYRAAWARTHLKLAGLVENTARGNWALTEKGRTAEPTDIPSSVADVRRKLQEKRKKNAAKAPEDEDTSLGSSWQIRLLDFLTKSLSPAAFEQLSQLLLREAGFKEVRVTGQRGDGGIDGVGKLQSGLLSETVLFQCKRYRGTVGPDAVREFRGTMQTRCNRGIILTTGTFTLGAREEATRIWAQPIELIDGERLCELLKEYRLGIEVKTIEEVTFTPKWFESRFGRMG